MRLVAESADFASVFETERLRVYPAIEAFEQRMGYAMDRDRLESAARVLACPVKVNPPCWQHGRVIYAATRRYLAAAQSPVTLFDIGTAKGFSALCLLWALTDAGVPGEVISTDVIDPLSHAIRNTVAEVDGLKTLPETLAPWPESAAIDFWHATGQAALARLAADGTRVHVAFVDGKHVFDVVKDEGERLAERQTAGDLALFDDCQIEGVRRAVNALGALYTFEPITATPGRAYALGVRR